MATKALTVTKKNSEEKTSEKYKKNLHRSVNNKVIAGVAGGIGEYFNIDPTIIRLIFILLTIFGGSSILIYLIFWLIMPGEDNKNNENVIKQNMDDISSRAKTFAHDLNIRTDNNPNDSKFWWGFLIIVFGIILLFQNLGIFDIINFHKFWPIIIIIIGIMLLLKKK